MEAFVSQNQHSGARLKGGPGININPLHFLMQAPAAIAILEGPEHTYTFANTLYLKLYGRTEAELLGRTVREVFPEVAGQGIYELFDSVYATGAPFNAEEFPARFEDDGVTKTGYYNFIIQPVRNDAGAVVALMVQALEITGQVEAKQRQSESQTELQELANAMPQLIWIADEQGEVIYYNERVHDYAGAHKDETGHWRWAGLLHPEDLPATAAAWTQALKTGETYSMEHRILMADGSYRWHLSRAHRQSNEKRQAVKWFGTATDIHERREATEALRQANEVTERQKRLYETVTDNTPDLIYIFDLNYRFTYANKALLAMWGKTWDEAIGKGLLENGYEPWHAEMHHREIDKVVATKQPIRGTVSFPHAELGKRIYDYIFSPVIDEAGEVVSIAGTTRDISEITNAEEALALSNEKFYMMANSIPQLAWITDEKGWIYWYNDRWYEYTGTTLEDMQGWGWKSVHHPRMIDGVVARFQAALDEGRDWEDTFMLRSKDGEYRWFLSRANVVRDGAGKPTGWFGTNTDITAQRQAQEAVKESEARFRTLAEDAPLWVWMADTALNATYANRAALQYLGLPDYSALTGKEWERYIHPDDLPLVYGAFSALMEQGAPFEMDIRMKRAETGAYEWFLNRGVARFEDGAFVGLVGTLINIQRQKELTENLEQLVALRTTELQRANEELHRSNADLQQFAHVASHDLKEPLRKIRTFSGMLQQKLGADATPDMTAYVGKINSAASRMADMIDGVLAYSSTNAGQQKTELVDLTETIRSIEGDAEVAIAQKGATITCANLPTIDGAPVLIYQLFYNLINNSLKFARADKPLHITVTGSEREVDGQMMAVVRVDDNGIGFDQEDAGRIFDTFSRLNPKDRYEGTGLGLALCKKIVERHGGTIAAQSSLGNGAAFIITLPLQQQAQNL